MPDPAKVTIKNIIYTIPILNGEMENTNQQILNLQESINNNKQRVINDTIELNNLNQQMMVMYIQQTGSFPN